jgi:hypothetical protein
VWMATLGKILTLDNLYKRIIIVVEWCYMCKQSSEFVNHLLLHSEVARASWRDIYSLTYTGHVWKGVKFVSVGEVKFFDVSQFSTLPQFVDFLFFFSPLVGSFFVYIVYTRVALLCVFQ